ncbi:MAG: ABC transporter permease, partial [Solobacterium sp.]|nr:ABC transporter permease [Solobacterium sp.]
YLDTDSVFITCNAGSVLGFKEGDIVQLETADLQTADLKVSALTDNYLGNYVYMRRSCYEKYFTDYTENGLLINLKEGADYKEYESLLKTKPHVISVMASDTIKDQFSTAFILINVVVYIVIIMSAALAFVVLFTLSSINVSERTREIATIKVLGFFDHEVHTYIDKETVLLTLIGVVIGIPLGTAFAQTISIILNLPSIYLAVSLHFFSYVIAALLCLVFVAAVNFFTDRYLNVIDPVEALKSVE